MIEVADDLADLSYVFGSILESHALQQRVGEHLPMGKGLGAGHQVQRRRRGKLELQPMDEEQRAAPHRQQQSAGAYWATCVGD